MSEPPPADPPCLAAAALGGYCPTSHFAPHRTQVLCRRSCASVMKTSEHMSTLVSWTAGDPAVHWDWTGSHTRCGGTSTMMCAISCYSHRIAAIGEAFTHCFSFKKLKTGSIMDLISCLSINRLNMFGYAKHSIVITNEVIWFFDITRLHFLVRGENASRRTT